MKEHLDGESTGSREDAQRRLRVECELDDNAYANRSCRMNLMSANEPLQLTRRQYLAERVR